MGYELRLYTLYKVFFLYGCKSEINAHGREENKRWKSFLIGAVLTKTSDAMNEPFSVCLLMSLVRAVCLTAFVFSELDENAAFVWQICL